MILKSRGSF